MTGHANSKLPKAICFVAAGDRRDHLDLQVNLLTEQRVTQIIQMLDRMSSRLGVDQHADEVSRELGRRVAVEHPVEELHSRLPDA